MIISSSNIAMNSERYYKSSQSRSRFVKTETKMLSADAVQILDRIKGDNATEVKLKNGKEESEEKKEQTKFSDILEDDATEQMTKSMLGMRSKSTARIASSDFRQAMEDIRTQCINYLMMLFFGKGKELQNYSGDLQDADTESVLDATLASGSMSASTGLYQSFSITNGFQTSYSEMEQTSYSVGGSVVNANGTKLDFNLSFSMSRSFSETITQITDFTQIQMMDPLVINLNSNVASLSDQKFEFDLDSDGILDSISMLNSGSGFLALDKDNSGSIENGTELFGTKSGDGFADLLAYDKDENGWIDEADEVWNKLLIWTKDEAGNDKLYTLKESGIGAICLQNASTDFSLNSLKSNAVNGMIRSTGVFLYENGNVGTIQHIDVAK